MSIFARLWADRCKRGWTDTGKHGRGTRISVKEIQRCYTQQLTLEFWVEICWIKSGIQRPESHYRKISHHLPINWGRFGKWWVVQFGSIWQLQAGMTEKEVRAVCKHQVWRTSAAVQAVRQHCDWFQGGQTHDLSPTVHTFFFHHLYFIFLIQESQV